ncbi:MAG: ornithine carbamoyltransferase [Halobacteriales archaeon]|nr:ornithine carbamoyltransferase [Halobacteriales archaeon]
MTHLLDIDDLTKTDIDSILKLATELKQSQIDGNVPSLLHGKTLSMLFEKPSTRTRVSFEVGMNMLGGDAITFDLSQLQLSRGETLSDTTKSLSLYVDAILARVTDHSLLEQLSLTSTIPIINGLSDKSHPCQALADLLTIYENFGNFDVQAAWVGDGNNVANSFARACSIMGIDLVMATPKGYELSPETLSKIESSGISFSATHDPRKAVSEADVVYTDTWVSMGDESTRDKRLSDFDGFQINSKLLDKTEALVMHCLPAHRDEEISTDILDGNRSLVWTQAENRLHAQNGLLVHILNPTQDIPE